MASKAYSKVKIAFSEAKLKSIESFLVDSSLLVTVDFLMAYFNVSQRQITNYVKSGLPKIDSRNDGRGGIGLYDINKCIEWRLDNLNKSKQASTEKAKARQEERQKQNAPPSEDIRDMSFEEAERLKKIVDFQIAEVKLAEVEGRLVDANDLDRAMSELAIMHKTDKTNDQDVLTVLLENKSSAEIRELLYSHNEERLEMLDSIINKEFKSKETLYEIVESILNKLSDGVEPSKIISKVNEC